MSEAKPTPGPWTQGISLIGGECVWLDGKTEPVHGMGADHSWIDCGTAANARLIADAGTVFHTTGLTPSQLVERVKELEEVLNCITSMCETHGDFSNGVTDPTGTIDEGNVIAGRIVGDARAVLTKYRTNAVDVKEHPGASVGAVLPAGWVPLTITHEGQYPEEVAYGPEIMMDRLGGWLGKYFAQIAAPAQMPDLQPLHNLLYLAQRQTSLGAMQRVVSEARLDLAKVRDAALSKARPNTAEGEAQAAPAAADFTTLGAAMRAIQQSIELIGEPADDRMRAVKRVLRGAVIVAEDSGELAVPAAAAVAGPVLPAAWRRKIDDAAEAMSLIQASNNLGNLETKSGRALAGLRSIQSTYVLEAAPTQAAAKEPSP